MRNISFAVATITLLTMTGCATKEYVKSETDPLADRLGKLEAKVDKMGPGLSDADRAAIKNANDKAQQALDATKDLDAKVKDEAARAEAAAQRAEAAAKDAQGAEKKSEKLFQLEQKK